MFNHITYLFRSYNFACVEPIAIWESLSTMIFSIFLIIAVLIASIITKISVTETRQSLILIPISRRIFNYCLYMQTNWYRPCSFQSRDIRVPFIPSRRRKSHCYFTVHLFQVFLEAPISFSCINMLFCLLKSIALW